MNPNFADLSKMSEDTVATIVKTNAAVAKGFELWSKYFVEMVSTSLADAVATSKKLAEVKTPTEFLQLQSKLTQSSIETLTQSGKKAAELTAAIAKEISEPLTERFKSNFEAITKAASKGLKAE